MAKRTKLEPDCIVKLPRKLPKNLRQFFWDCRFSSLNGERDGDFVAYRILESGDWDSLVWLCRQTDEDCLRTLVCHHRGRGLDVEQLRFWQAIWNLPKREVDCWIHEESDLTWNRSAS